MNVRSRFLAIVYGRLSIYRLHCGQLVVICIQHCDRIRHHMLKALCLGFKHTIPVAQKLQMAVADICDDHDIRARHSRKSVHLAKIRYAHLEHRYLMAFPDSENGEWQAYLIVEIACGLVDAVFLLKD